MTPLTNNPSTSTPKISKDILQFHSLQGGRAARVPSHRGLSDPPRAHRVRETRAEQCVAGPLLPRQP